MVVGDDWGALEAGTAYALAGHLLDRQAEKIAGGAQDVRVRVEAPMPPEPVFVDASDGRKYDVTSWDNFIGQEATKRLLRAYIADSSDRGEALPHVLLTSDAPGVGKTELGNLIGKEMGGDFKTMVPPFHPSSLYQATWDLPDFGVLFINRIDKMGDSGSRLTEQLLTVLEEQRLYLRDGLVELRDITVVGATTERDRLPEAVLARFPLQPYFEPYDPVEIAGMVGTFQAKLDVRLRDDTVLAITHASRGIPRQARQLVLAARAAEKHYGHKPTAAELLEFTQLQPDGTTRRHIAYLVGLLRHFRRTNPEGKTEYTADQRSMMTVLRETEQGLARIERQLLEQGLIDLTPSGRRLTKRGWQRAVAHVRETEGK